MATTAQSGEPAPSRRSPVGPFVEMRGDELLRRAGFRIHSRAKNSQPEWSRGGIIVAEPLALELAGREQERLKAEHERLQSEARNP